MGPRGFWAAGALILVAHGWASLDAARKLSPAWDEIVYPAAGLAQWKTGELRRNTEHPFLSKLWSAAPLAAAGVPLPSPQEGEDAYRAGFRFTFRGEASARKIILLGRLPSVFASVAAGAVLGLWMSSLLGGWAALVSMACFGTTPIVLSRASTSLLEGPLFLFGLLCLASYDRWRRLNDQRWLWASGIALGFACACKMIAVPLAAALLAAEALWLSKGRPWPKRALSCAILLLSPAAVLVLVYAPWDGGLSALKSMAVFSLGAGGNSYLFFWAGRLLSEGSSLISWGALFVKSSPFLLAAGAYGGWVWFRSERERHGWGLLWLVIVAYGVMPILLSSPLSTVQLSPIHLALAALSGGAAAASSPWRRWVGAALVLMGAADIARVHPNHMAYFSPLVGGSAAGARWLGDSDQDWGQSLPALAAYAEREAGAGRPAQWLLCYSGPGDPAAYGIRARDLFSPSLFVREHPSAPVPADADRVLLAVGTKVLQTETRYMDWLVQNRRPAAVPDPCWRVYDLSGDAEAFRWMGHVYLDTRRPAEAAWAFRRASALQPGRQDDRRMLQALAGVR